MNRKAKWLASAIAVTGLFVAVSNNGCGDDDEGSIETRIARKGEACESTRDCTPGLACVPISSSSAAGVCVVGVFNVAPTNKECAITECSVPADCCKDVPAICTSYKQQCDAARDAGSPSGDSICQAYDELCKCDESLRGCEAGKCVTKCIDDDGCRNNGSRSKCLGGKCGQCSSDTECKAINDQLTCVNAVCQPPCQGDGDCPGFERCVGGKCVDGGCQSPRECIGATRNVEATCGTDGKCIVPCQTDLECGNPKGYSFFSCINNQCLYVGCETDKDCRFFFFGSGGTSSGGTSGGGTSTSSGGTSSGGTGLALNEHVVCRDKVNPNPTTIPAK